MLTNLNIRNLALVESLSWEVGPGLVCVTGETGAGKSVIVGALKLALGERADKKMIRTGEGELSVEAVFEVGNVEEVNVLLTDLGLEPCEGDTLIVRRVISRKGSNRQFVNCSPATLAALKGLGQLLVDLHGPHDHQSLLSNARQLAMLDAFAGCGKELEKYRDAHAVWRAAADEHDAVANSERATAQEIDLLRFQVEEIESAGLNAEAEEEHAQRYRVASGGRHLAEVCGDIMGRLRAGSTSVLGGLEEVSRLFRDLEKHDPSTNDLAEGLRSAQVELQELEDSLQEYSGRLELDPAEISALEERLNLVENLKRKYGNTVPEVIAFGQDASRRLGQIEGRGEHLEALRATVDRAATAVTKAGKALGKKRRQAAPRLSKAIARHLEDLGFKQSCFELEFLTAAEPLAGGLEHVDFLFTPNPGEPLKPLRVVASSGEMSRVMLAVKSALAKEDSIPLLVFDEIDANVGGEIAVAVGAKMAALGENHQVIAITHFPQVAARAQSHYVVAKQVQKGRTYSRMNGVDGGNRVAEISRMLGGASKSAEAHAESLLAEATS